MIGCPACAGVLRIEAERGGHPRFVCSVGHAFALDDLLQAKEEELEKSQWSTIALLTHVQMIVDMLLAAAPPSDGGPWRNLHRRMDQVRAHVQMMTRMIEETQWPARQPNVLHDRETLLRVLHE